MDLSGTWLAAPADEHLRRAFPDPGFDHAGWEPVPVPGHWRSVAAFSRSDGPLLYRHRFEAPAAASGRRRWLVFDGIFYQADVWLDGDYVGDTEGYFVPHAFEVPAVGEGGEHVLAVEVACPRPSDLRAKRTITGTYQHSDVLDPAGNPGGIWRDVRIEETGPVRIAHLRPVCSEATPERAVVHLRAVLDAAAPGAATVRTELAGTDHEQTVTLAAGENRLEWRVTVERPELWWPAALGPAPLVPLTVAITTPDDEEASDRRTVTTGLRQVRLRDWVLSVNGERLFLKGAMQGPTRPRPGDVRPEDTAALVDRAQEAGLDFVRVHGHIAPPSLYAAADARGLLLWQDLPLQWGHARGIRRQAVRQAREAVDLLAHHPSVFLWCGHDDPAATGPGPGAGSRRERLRSVAAQQLPTWNKTYLDGAVKRALERADPSRPVIAHSGIVPHAGAGGTDSHLHLGWSAGDERDLPALAARWPRLVRFVTGIGAQSVPATDDFLHPDRWPDLDWERLAQHHALQRDVLTSLRLDPASFASLAAWRDATQRHQADVVRFQVEVLRRLKYQPTGGFAVRDFCDPGPAVSWSLIDHGDQPKPAYDALRQACRPVVVVADRPAAVYAPGDPIGLDVHVVSDRRTPITDAMVVARLVWSSGQAEWRWAGAIAADACVRVGRVEMDVPDAEGPLTLHLCLTVGDHQAGEGGEGDERSYGSSISR